MGLYRIQDQKLVPVGIGRFSDDDIRERRDLQRMLREAIDVVDPDIMVVAEEFSDWADSQRRIDLLCLDREARLVVVELKRSRDGGHMDLQALRYAAMVSVMSFERIVAAHTRYLASIDSNADAEEAILDFLGWDDGDGGVFGEEVRIVLVSEDFSTEITSTILWLHDRDIDVRCVKMFPHKVGDETLVSVEQVLPLPSAESFYVRAKEKSREAARHRASTGYWFVNIGEHDGPDNHRSWTDARRHGFIAAGGPSVRQIRQLTPGDRLFAYRNGHGYVGAAVVVAGAAPWSDFVPAGADKPLPSLPLEQPRQPTHDDPDRSEHCLGVRWVRAVEPNEAIKAASRRNTACAIRDRALVDELIGAFAIGEGEWQAAGG